jgi:pyrimidine operon attenuation protein/uracil phosphoribosyltransferase
VELLVLVDRRFTREVPIQANYLGTKVDTIDDARVIVKWKELDGEENVHLLKKDA